MFWYGAASGATGEDTAISPSAGISRSIVSTIAPLLLASVLPLMSRLAVSSAVAGELFNVEMVVSTDEESAIGPPELGIKSLTLVPFSKPS